MHLTSEAATAVIPAIRELVLAPLNYPGILPTVLPIIIGGIVIELYFGKHKEESLGWNSSVANSVIWITTGLTLLITGNVDTIIERYVVYFIIGVGALVAYMDFFHKWPAKIAFITSSAISVYSLAYLAVVIVKTPINPTTTTLKAAAVFLVGVTAFFELIKMFETPANDMSFTQ